MLNAISILIGLFAAVLMLPALLPFFGWGMWLVIPVAAVGLIAGMLSSGRTGRNLNIVVIVIGALRLMLGGGFF